MFLVEMYTKNIRSDIRRTLAAAAAALAEGDIISTVGNQNNMQSTKQSNMQFFLKKY